jgi:type II secretory pathway component HofQ
MINRARELVVFTLALLAIEAGAASPTQRMNFDFHRADLHGVLRVLCEAGRVNLVMSEDVQGTVTLRLRNVAWSDALHAVLSVHQLGFERRGNIVRVAPLKQLNEEAKLAAELAKSRDDAAPLETHIIPVNYARASDLLPHVQSLLSPRGTVSVDVRTNVLIVRDIRAPGL